MSDETKETIEAEIVAEVPAPSPTTPPVKRKGWPKGKARKTSFQRLDSRRQKFVMEVLNGRTQTDAAALAGYSTKSPGALRAQSVQLMNNQKIQNALQEKLDTLYPNLNEKVAAKLAEIMEMPLREGPHSQGVSIAEFLATARFLQDVYGWKAPTKSLHVRANVKTKRLLPSD